MSLAVEAAAVAPLVAPPLPSGAWTCPICLEDEAGGGITALTCAHTFCTPCVASWLRTNPTCPVCKTVQPRRVGVTVAVVGPLAAQPHRRGAAVVVDSDSDTGDEAFPNERRVARVAEMQAVAAGDLDDPRWARILQLLRRLNELTAANGGDGAAAAPPARIATRAQAAPNLARVARRPAVAADQNVRVRCGVAGCGGVVLRRNYARHAARMHAMERCAQCHDEMPHFALRRHASRCRGAPAPNVEAPNIDIGDA